MNPRQTITESISQEVHRSRRRLRLATGSLLFVQGEKAESVFVVGSGCVRLVVHTDDASELFLFRAAEGEIFAEDHLLLESYQYSAIVETPTVVWSISRELFTQNVFEDQSLFRQYIQCLNSTRQQAFSNIRRLGIRSSPDRVLDLLSSLADDSVSAVQRRYVLEPGDGGWTLVGYGHRQQCWRGESRDWTASPCP